MNSYNIDICALELILLSLRNVNFLQIHEMQFSDCTYYIGSALMYTAEAFSVHFQQIIRVPFLRTLSADEFISYALPKCLQLSKIPTNYNILLAISFLIEMVTCLSNQYNCFKFLDAAKKCLVVIMRRKLCDIRRWNELTWYCRWRNRLFYSRTEFMQPMDMLCPTPEYKDLVMRMIYCNLNEPVYLTSVESSILAIEDIPDQEKENIESQPSVPACDFCGGKCKMFALYFAETHWRYTRSLNVNILMLNSRLFRDLTNIPAPRDRYIFLDE